MPRNHKLTAVVGPNRTICRRSPGGRAAVAEKHTAQAESSRAAPSFRPLNAAEAEALVGAELLTTLGESLGESRPN
jgi:hypothetical protein